MGKNGVDGVYDKDPKTDASAQRMYAGTRNLMDHFEAVPVYIFVCGSAVYPPGNPLEELIPSALYPAAQNLIVAARALPTVQTGDWCCFYAEIEGEL